MESNDGQIQHVITTLELASLGARYYNYRYMDVHDIVAVYISWPHEYIIFETISLQGRHVRCLRLTTKLANGYHAG